MGRWWWRRFRIRQSLMRGAIRLRLGCVLSEMLLREVLISSLKWMMGMKAVLVERDLGSR